MHTQITAKIEESAQREFEEILAERDVVRGLNELERVMGEAARRRREGVLDGPGVACVFPLSPFFPPFISMLLCFGFFGGYEIL